MNTAVMSNFKTGTINLDGYTIKWSIGGRIVVECLRTQRKSFFDYSKKALKTLVEAYENSKKKRDNYKVGVYFNTAAFSMLTSEHVSVESSDDAIYIVCKKERDSTTHAFCGQDKRCFNIGKTQSKLIPGARYLMDSDGELHFMEYITVENVLVSYDDPVVTAYFVKR